MVKAQLEREQVARSTASGGVVRVVLSKDARVLVDTPEFQTTLYRKKGVHPLQAHPRVVCR